MKLAHKKAPQHKKKTATKAPRTQKRSFTTEAPPAAAAAPTQKKQPKYQTKPQYKKGPIKQRYTSPSALKDFNFPEGRLEGRVLKFEKGFGFIQHTDSKKALFFHISEFKTGGFKQIFAGQYVSFEAGEHQDKKVAKNVLPKVQAVLPSVELPLVANTTTSVDQV